MKRYLFNETNKRALIRQFAMSLTSAWLLFLGTSSRVTADNSIQIDHNEPVDRRIITTETCASERMNASQLGAKQLEAAAMVRWFSGKKRVYETELKQHRVEASYNKMMLERLKSISGSIPERTILELEKRVAVDALDTEQLEAYIDMARADIDAAEARLQFLKGECK